MCGIIGYFTTEEKADAVSRYRFLHQALIADTMRGDDSTGAFFVKHDSVVGTAPDYCKSTAAGYDFVTYDPDWHALSGTGAEFYAAIGHNRSATIGKIGADTAHPFQRGPITLVHNGTLRTTFGMPIPEHQGGYYNDSDTIAGNLEDTPIDKLTADMSGAYSLVWHDSRDNTMNIVRNSERPLYLATVKGQNTMFLASESMMMQWILSRLKVDIQVIAYPKPHQWLRFEHGSLKPEIITVPEYAPKYGSYGGYNSHGYGGDGGYANNPWGDLYDEADYEAATPEHINGPKAQAPQGPTPNGRSSSSYSAENRMKLGGRKRIVPTRAQELLLDVDLLVEDRELFEPLVSWAGSNKKFRAVSGYLPETGMSAMVYGVPAVVVERTFNRQWVIQPITVKMNDIHEPVVICKLRHTDASSPTGAALLTPLEPYFDDSPRETPKDEKVVASNGGVMPLSEYLNRTGGGCIHCSGNIHISDADEIIWVNEGRDPVCPVCVAEFRAEAREENPNEITSPTL